MALGLICLFIAYLVYVVIRADASNRRDLEKLNKEEQDER